MPATLKYTDESDKCYGITGMAIGLVIWNAEDIMAAINLDAGPADVFEFVPEYYFCGNPRISAKNSWSHVLKHYQATMGMLIGNILCRSYVLHGTHPSKETRAKLLVCLDEEGRSSCALESDEVERVFNRSYAYLGKSIQPSRSARGGTRLCKTAQGKTANVTSRHDGVPGPH